MSKITTTREMIDAAKAADYLARNIHNRPMARPTIIRYTADMRTGNWRETADPIRFDRDGRLIDGQHRLQALIEAELDHALPFHVVRGLHPEAQLFMDQGRKRTTGDQMSLHGYKNGNRLAAGCRLYLLWRENMLFSDRDQASIITTATIIEWADDNPELLDYAYEVTPQGRATIVGEPRVLMAFSLIIAQIDEQRLKDFYDSLTSLVGLPEGSPILVLHKRLLNVRTERTRLQPREQLAMFLQTWNYWVAGRSIAQLGRPRGGLWNASNYPVPLDPSTSKPMELRELDS